MADTRAATLAEQFEKALGELIQAVEEHPDDQWHSVCGDEGWTVAATAHHVGAQWPLEKELLDAAVGLASMPGYTWDDVNARNEQHGQEFSAASKAEVLAILRDGGPTMASFVRGLSDAQLDSPVAFPLANGAPVTPQQLIEGGVLVGHVVAHLKSIRAVV